MALAATTGSPEFERRVEERIAQLPPVHMTAMQAMTTILWRPMAMMGILVMASGAIIAGVNSFNVDECFGLGAQGDIDSRASFQSIQTWLPGYQFMGMALIFAAITMVVASILGRLPFAPPKGTSASAVFHVMRAASPRNSSMSTIGWYRRPPLNGPRALLCCTR